MNHPLARAMRGAGLDTTDVAARLGVDPKTVTRWLGGRVPYPRHRDVLARITGWNLGDLWPELAYPSGPTRGPNEVSVAYPYRSAAPIDAWRRLFTSAVREIDILAYSALFLAEDVATQQLLRDKAQSGVQVRIALGDPDGAHVAERGAEEGIGPVMGTRIQNALMLYQPLTRDGAEIRIHDTVLYNSIYRADDELLVNPHVYGHPASYGPVLHLLRTGSDGMAAHYASSFERVWTAARSRTPT
ncbi:XRE family transcriptional regulator [Actinomycetes bacterium KLBMP 9797]